MIVLPGDDMTKLMIFGGSTGDPYTNDIHHLNDIWSVLLFFMPVFTNSDKCCMVGGRISTTQLFGIS
jgi:hypothetical protein